MKDFVRVLRSPHQGGQIIVPRRLLECVFREVTSFSEPEAFLYILHGCAFSANSPDPRLKRGQMITSVRRLSAVFGWKQSSTRRFLHELQHARLISLSAVRGGTRVTCLCYEDVCSFKPQNPQDGCVEPAAMDKQAEEEFNRFWAEYHKKSGLMPHDVYLAKRVWAALPPEERELAFRMIRDYLVSVDDPQRIRSGLNYLRCKSYFF